MLEVTGVVNSPNALTEESCCPFSDTFGALRWCLLSRTDRRMHLLLP